jgi:hypothetical protein
MTISMHLPAVLGSFHPDLGLDGSEQLITLQNYPFALIDFVEARLGCLPQSF